MFSKKDRPPQKKIPWRVCNDIMEEFFMGIPGAKRFMILMGQKSSENHHLGWC